MMPFTLQMQPAPLAAKESAPPTNEAVFDGWRRYEETRLQPVTLKHYEYEIRFFIEAWSTTLVSTLKKIDVKSYLREYERRCQFFRRRFKPSVTGAGCTKRRDLAQCGAFSCTAYNPLLFQTADKHLQALVSLYDFLVEIDVLEHNFIRDLKKSWVGKNKRRYRYRPKRDLEAAELRTLINGCKRLNHKILYAILAKTGIRIREALLLLIDRQHLNLDEGWLKVPDFQGKRRGNRYLIIDFELRRILQKYLAWREQHVARGEYGSALTDILILNHWGKPFNPDDNTAILQKMMTPDCVAAGLMEVNGPVERRVRPHRFRHFFSDSVKKAGADTYWLNVLRGDLPKDANERVYVHPKLADIRTQYSRFAPVLGLL